MSKYQLAALWSCLFIIGSAEVIAGPMMAMMGRHFGVPSSTIAYLPAAYGLAYGAVALLAGPYSDHLGRKRPLLVGLAGFSLFSALLPHSGNLVIASFLSALSGVCAAIIQPNALSLVGDAAAPEDAGRRIGQVFIGLMTAFVVTPAMAGWIASALNWQAAYYLLSSLAGGAALLVARLFAADSHRAGEKFAFFASHRGALNIREVRLRLSVSYLWLGWMAGMGAIAAEVAARKLGLQSTEAGLLAGYWGVVVIAGNMSGHRLQRRFSNAVLPLLAGVAIMGVFAFALPVRSTAMLAIVGTPWAFGYGCAGPLHHASLSNLSDHFRGTINSYHASFLNLGIFSVSFLFGAMLPVASVEIFCGVVAMVGSLGVLLLVVATKGHADPKQMAIRL